MPSPLGLLTSTSNNSPIVGQYQVLSGKAVKSIFGNAQFSPFPTGNPDGSGNVTKIKTAAENQNDEIYDVSIQSIVDYTTNHTAMKLTYADFAYLKDVGVYPNNRLIVARRFQQPVRNDLTQVKASPMATLVSYVKDENFLDISFSEQWVDADATFQQILNDIGADLTSGNADNPSTLGDAMAGGVGVVPLPGFTEGLQYLVMSKMGITDNNGIGNHPLGNPNLIREAMRRKTVAKDQADSGLSFKVQIQMKIEYEQKFISGLDPTLVYLDILQNVLTFATSDSIFQFNGNFATGGKEFVDNLISGDPAAIMKSIAQFTAALVSAVTEVLDFLVNAESDKKDTPAQQNQAQDQNNGQTESADEGPSLLENLAERVKTILQTTIGTIISKYKIRILGVINALTGSPSGPWHITIGNPKRPIFCSGDMLMKSDVKVNFGKTLAFNDLPASIVVDCTFENARNLGAQEIFDRLNTGKGRSYIRVQKSFVEVNESITQEQIAEGDRAIKKNQITELDKQIAAATDPAVRDQLIKERDNLSQALQPTQPPTTPTPPATTPTGQQPNTQAPVDTLKIENLDQASGPDYLTNQSPPSTESNRNEIPPATVPENQGTPNLQRENKDPLNTSSVAERSPLTDQQKITQAQAEEAAKAESLAAAQGVVAANRTGNEQSDVSTPGDTRPVGEQTPPPTPLTYDEVSRQNEALKNRLDGFFITLNDSRLAEYQQTFRDSDPKNILSRVYILESRADADYVFNRFKSDYPKSYMILPGENSTTGPDVYTIFYDPN